MVSYKDMDSYKAMEERLQNINEKDNYIVKIDTTKATKLQKLISTSIEKVDDSLDISTFAKAIANVLEEDYGTHNYKTFFTVIQKEL
ncbi:hypothetical protein HUE87_04025 [Candidatus Sulfurimonas marisnigri]|uniref:Uncharacterized protein n=1 Tax=Candidatus Sulfurimonas marisnigri TaxID=2740405 RepID=A0A7S7M2L3_9BACT|nr:hypothetical protein [Candidatus Sulfurimonas marisnigri]QOY55413.1 hypothetical protein HUE87_04025 [Candidatus Sulfurimonas marisnigri]